MSMLKPTRRVPMTISWLISTWKMETCPLVLRQADVMVEWESAARRGAFIEQEAALAMPEANGRSGAGCCWRPNSFRGPRPDLAATLNVPSRSPPRSAPSPSRCTSATPPWDVGRRTLTGKPRACSPSRCARTGAMGVDQIQVRFRSREPRPNSPTRWRRSRADVAPHLDD